MSSSLLLDSLPGQLTLDPQETFDNETPPVASLLPELKSELVNLDGRDDLKPTIPSKVEVKLPPPAPSSSISRTVSTPSQQLEVQKSQIVHIGKETVHPFLMNVFESPQKPRQPRPTPDPNQPSNNSQKKKKKKTTRTGEYRPAGGKGKKTK